MTALLTVTQLREHVETDLADTALQRLLDSEDAEIVRRCGALASVTETIKGGGELLFLARPAASITTVTEEVYHASTTLATDDWELWWSQALRRDDDGTNPRATWGDEVTVTYVPVSDAAQRALALIDLVKLALAYSGLQQQAVGQADFSATGLDYRRERERILGRLAPRGGIVLA